MYLWHLIHLIYSIPICRAPAKHCARCQGCKVTAYEVFRDKIRRPELQYYGTIAGWSISTEFMGSLQKAPHPPWTVSSPFPSEKMRWHNHRLEWSDKGCSLNLRGPSKTASNVQREFTWIQNGFQPPTTCVSWELYRPLKLSLLISQVR